MPYLGKQQAQAALTTSDITDGIISTAKLASTLDLSSKTVTLPSGVGGSMVLLNTTTITSDTTNLDFNSSLITSTYAVYEIIIEYMSSANSSAIDTNLKLSADNGSSFVSSIDQMSHRDRQDDQATGGNTFDIATKDQSEVHLFSGLEDDRPNIGVGTIRIFNPMDANVHTLVTHITCNDVPGFSDNIRNHFGCARDDAAQAINFFRITMASGDIEKAKVKLYGIN